MKKVKGRRRKAKVVISQDCDSLKEEFKDAQHMDIENPKIQSLSRCMSKEDRDSIAMHENEYDYLYPILDDPNFNEKIARKKEFYDSRYEEKSPKDFDNIKEVAQTLCDNTEFELAPHQMFVRNFMSFQTPYNGLLLFHGVGTGKTCSAISVCEEMRTYLNQLGITKRIIIVASPAVQENFKLQLFDERKLKEVNGLWNIKACTGNKFLKEINPMNMKGLDRSRVVRQIKRIISQSYHFQGYIEFSNYITRVMNKTILSGDTPDVIKSKQQRALKKEFSNRMLVIDEVHNLRITDDGTIKPSSENILRLVSNTDNLKILILSATPMFNSYSEIIWLLNLLNLNDKRYPIKDKEVFDKKGNFKQNDDGEEIGKELLIQKMLGYISYVRGNNPFTFPYSVYPLEAGSPNSSQELLRTGAWQYPSKQVNGAAIVAPINILDLTITDIGPYQLIGYNFVINSLKKKYKTLSNPEKGLSYTVLEPPLQALNMIYPHADLGESGDADLYTYLYGKRGLARVMNYEERTKSNFKYKDKTLQNFGRIFSPENIGKYSAKIAYICESIYKSQGIVFIYSQYIDGGAVPIALALEEMGIRRYGANKSLFEKAPTAPIDALTMKPEEAGKTFQPAKYIMITGDKNLTPDVRSELKAATGPLNINGEKVKVIIVSRAGSEGLDFQNIRQTHILDPWYNLNRQDQIIGRAVRNFSHCALPYEQRNVSIFLYGTRLPTDVESVDLYIYRLAEDKARKIATVVRVLKENAVDCLLNRQGQNFSAKKINKTVDQKISTGEVIKYKIGDKDNSQICDFTRCEYNCNSKVQEIAEVDTTTYNESFIIMNLDKILQRIRLLFKESYVYEKTALVAALVQIKQYPLDQIYTALNFLVNEQNEYITDMLGRLGRLVNIGNFYLFQPVELSVQEPLSRFERETPISYKRDSLIFNLPEKIPSYMTMPQDESKEEIELDASVYDELVTQLGLLQNPGLISAAYKEDWTRSAAWAIRNLSLYNKISTEVLLPLAIDHLIDVLPFNKKVQLLRFITQNNEAENPLHIMINNYFNTYILQTADWKGIVLADFSKSSKKSAYTILSFKNGDWIDNKEEIRPDRLFPLFEKFQVKDLSVINNIIGFMVLFKAQLIVFKTKELSLSSKGRTNKGSRCDRGEGKGVVIKRLNNLLSSGVQPIKYKMNKSSIVSIYGDTNIKQLVQLPGKRKVKDVKITGLQLCIESELLLRFYDKTKYQDKRWFFDTVGTLINNIVKIGR